MSDSKDWGTPDPARKDRQPAPVSDAKGPELLQGIAKPKTLVAWRPFLLRYVRGWLAGVALLMIAIALTDPGFLADAPPAGVQMLLVSLIVGLPVAWITDLGLRDTVTRRTHVLVAAGLACALGTATAVFGNFTMSQRVFLIVGSAVFGFLVRLAAGFRGLPTADRPASS